MRNMDTESPTHGACGPAPNRPAPLLQVRGVTIQYKTPQTLVTAVYRVDFDRGLYGQSPHFGAGAIDRRDRRS